jgi:hypothetical protein
MSKHISLDTTAQVENKWRDHTTTVGLGGIHSATLSTILSLTEQNLDFKKVTGADALKAFEN